MLNKQTKKKQNMATKSTVCKAQVVKHSFSLVSEVLLWYSIFTNVESPHCCLLVIATTSDRMVPS